MVASDLIERENVALLVVDVQERLAPLIANGEQVVANIVKLIRFAKIVGIPVLHMEQMKLGETVAPIRAELADAPAIQKLDFGGFGCDAVSEAVRKLGKTTLVLAGIEAHICVTQTALGALPEYNVHVVSDATSSRSLHNWEIALRRLEHSGVTITSTEMVIYELLRCAGTDEFRAVLPLIKEG